VAIKSLITKALGADNAPLPFEPLDTLEANMDTPVPPLDEVLRTAMRKAPIRIAELGLENQKIAETFTRSNLRPTLSAFVEINSFSLSPGLSSALKQMWQYAYPEYTVGFTLNFSVKNRAAQADDVRARLDRQQAQVALEQIKANIGIQVRTGLMNATQTRAQVEASQRAVTATRQTAEAEQVKWNSGFSTLENVYQTQLDLVRAQSADIQARADYAKAIIAQEVQVGDFLEKHNIEYDSAFQGGLWRDSTKP
jgi:outer membrane protein TolC